MRKLGSALLYVLALIEILSASVAAFVHTAYRHLGWSESHPLPYVAFLAIVSAVLWSLFALRMVLRGPVLTSFVHTNDDGQEFTVVAPVYPEDVFANHNALIVSRGNASRGKEPTKPTDNGPPDDATPT